MDLSIIREFFNQSVLTVLSDLLGFGGWLIFNFLFLKGGFWLLKEYRAKQYTKNWKWICLAIDVPPLNVQTPKAVEQLFSHIFSVYESPAIGTVFHRGFVQFYYSFEIVSIEGYIQFIIRTLDIYRNVIEAAVYAQYPEAEITEVEDYTTDLPSQFPNPTHNAWAGDFVLSQHYAYPIRLYKEFEHSISKDTILKDPMGTFLESFSRIGPGEQMWYQMIIEPLAEKVWKAVCIKEIKKVIGEKSAAKGGNPIVNAVVDVPIKALAEAGNQLVGFTLPEAAAADKKSEPNKILYLTPGQKKLVEAMEDKISKMGYRTKIRAVYIARKEVFDTSHGVNSLVGAINQFNVPSSNALLPKYFTSVRYFYATQRKDFRRRLLVKAYKQRNMYAGLTPYILNIEELATLWHFPMSHAKVPLLQKAGTKRTEPPAGLPVEHLGNIGSVPPPGAPSLEKPKEKTGKKYITDSGHVMYADDVKFG